MIKKLAAAAALALTLAACKPAAAHDPNDYLPPISEDGQPCDGLKFERDPKTQKLSMRCIELVEKKPAKKEKK